MFKLTHKTGKLHSFIFEFEGKSFSIKTTEPLTRLKKISRLIDSLINEDTEIKIGVMDVGDLHKLKVISSGGGNLNLLLTINGAVETLIDKLNEVNKK